VQDVTGSAILLVEDEASIADNVVFAFESEGFEVTWQTLGHEAVALLGRRPFDLVILDVGLPDGSGFERCKEIRATSAVPILFLTARGEEIDRVIGFEIGADDYVTKPFSPRELVARARAILRRARAAPAAPTPTPGATSAFTVDEDRARISYRGAPLSLTRYEYLLLKHLVAHPERIWSRGQLMEQVWGSSQTSLERSVDAHVKSLRHKLRAVAPGESPIQTHRGLGYSLSTGDPG
jgi:two-component system catabolic regulation response regulator CreB